MMVVNKRQITIAGLIILICVAGYLNWSYKNEGQKDIVPAINNEAEVSKKYGEAQLVSGNNIQKQENDLKGNYFADAKINKEKARAEAIELLKITINSQNSDQKAKADANEEIKNISKSIEKEAIIENLLKAKGFDEAIIFINRDSVNVIIGSMGLLPSDTAKIQDIVTNETQVPVEKIKIMEIKK